MAAVIRSILFILYKKSYQALILMKKQSKTLRKIQSDQQISVILQRDLKDLKAKLKAISKGKREDRRSGVIKLQKVQMRNINNLIMSFENSIFTKEEQDQSHSYEDLKVKLQDYKNTYEKMKKELEFLRNEGRQEQDIYKERSMNQMNTKEQYAEKIERTQQQSADAVKNMLRMLYQTKQIGHTVNVQLERQIEALDNVNQNLMETQSTMKRALRHINYFARSVYTDKLLIVLLVLVVLAVIAVIILSAMGKISGPKTDVLG